MFYVHQKFLPGEAEGKNLIHEIQTLFYLRANAPSYKITILKKMLAKVKKQTTLIEYVKEMLLRFSPQN